MHSIASKIVTLVIALIVVAGAAHAHGGKPHLLGTEVMGDLSPYKVGAHQHVPEIKQATGAASLSFTPVLAPMPRGILATVTARPAGPGVTAAEVRQALHQAYGAEPFVHLLPEGRWPHTAATQATAPRATAVEPAPRSTPLDWA